MVTLGTRGVAVFPPASEAEVICALPADVVVAEVVVEQFGIREQGRAVQPSARKRLAGREAGRRRRSRLGRMHGCVSVLGPLDGCVLIISAKTQVSAWHLASREDRSCGGLAWRALALGTRLAADKSSAKSPCLNTPTTSRRALPGTAVRDDKSQECSRSSRLSKYSSSRRHSSSSTMTRMGG